MSALILSANLWSAHAEDSPAEVEVEVGETVNVERRRPVIPNFEATAQRVRAQIDEFDTKLSAAYGRSGVTMSLIAGQALEENINAIPVVQEGGNDFLAATQRTRRRSREAAEVCLFKDPQKVENARLLGLIARFEGTDETESSRMTELRENLHRHEIFYRRIQAYIANGPGRLRAILSEIQNSLTLTDNEREALNEPDMEFTDQEAAGIPTSITITPVEAYNTVRVNRRTALAREAQVRRNVRDSFGENPREEMRVYLDGIRAARAENESDLQSERVFMNSVERRLQELRTLYHAELTSRVTPERRTQYQAAISNLRSSYAACIRTQSFALLSQQIAPSVRGPISPVPPGVEVSDTTLAPNRNGATAAAPNSGSAAGAR